MTANPVCTCLNSASLGEPTVRLMGPFMPRDKTKALPMMIRRVLALLALNVNSRVGNERMAEELWGGIDNVSDSYAKTIQTYIGKLRACTGLTIETVHEGYMLVAPVHDVDALRFMDLVDKARVELKSGQLDAAHQLLQIASVFARRPFLEEVEQGVVLSMWTPTLNDYCQDTQILQFQLALRLGRHDEVLNQLRMVWRAKPTREDVAALLMLALYRSQRTAEAIRVYHQVHECLVDELGMDPGIALRTLFQQVLAEDPTLSIGGVASVLAI